MNKIDISLLKRFISYDPETGIFTWKENRKNVFIGSLAGNVDKFGYVTIRVANVPLKGHRVAWAITYNEWPIELIDHINGNPSDNKISNLRTSNNSQNSQNKRRALPSSRSGLMGAMFDKSTGRYRARIRVGEKRISIGSFKTPEEAHDAYIKAKRIHHEFCTI